MSSPVAQDLALKKFTSAPQDQKPNYNWRDILRDEEVAVPEVQVLCPHGEERFDLSEVADTVGRSLANLMLAKGEKDIFSDKNQRFVAGVTREVAAHLTKRALERGPLRVSLHDLYVLIEKTLVDNNAHDVAKSLLVKRASKLNGSRDTHGVTVRLIRRNHQVVPWNEAKIEIAIRKAFLSLQKDPAPASAICRAVSERARQVKQAFLHIEEVQDMVQEELMKSGHYKVAEDYILYRAHRSAARIASGLADEAAAPTPPSQQNTMVVVQRADGSTYLWDGTDLKKRIEFAAIGLDLCLTSDEIEAELRRALFDNIALGDLNNTIILNAKTLIEKDADFAKFAGRIQLTYIYEEVLGWDIVKDGIGALKKFHQQGFAKYLDRGIEIKRLSPRLKEYDLAKMSAALDPSADLEFDFLGIQTLYDRYLIIDKTGKRSKRLETPQFFWMRVSMGLFLDEKKKGREDWAIRLYDLYKSRRFCSSTPTLFNAGTLHSQLSSCYLYYVDDTIEGIFQRGIADNAYLSKWAGGLGGSWTSVRGTGAHIAGTNGESQGVIPFLKLHNDQLVAVNQGGKRKGSGCAYLESWHNDIFEFLELRRNTGDDRRRTHDMNTANWIPDLFMKRMEARGTWTLFRANETPDLHHLYGRKFEEAYLKYEKMGEEGKIQAHKIEALELWKKMLSMLFETGHPWITFKDPCNVRSPQDHVGVIHSSNLCTEITLNTSNDETAVCNLGSVILDSHLKPDGSLDLEKLRDTIRVAVRALDNVIDINFYPTAAAKLSNGRHRPIGLGIMGLANSLYMKGVAFASQEAVEFNDEFMEAIAFYAYEASSDLAAERGAYSTYKGSKWDRGLLPPDTVDLLEQERGLPIQVPRGGRMDWTPLRKKIAKQGMRNSNVLAIAPTATISNITNTSPCIEPTYKNLYVKSNLSGEFVVLNPYLVKDLKARGLWNQEMSDSLKYFDGELKDIEAIPADIKARYLTAFGVDFKWVIDAAARRQKWIDQAQSVNLWLKTPDLKTLSHMYRSAWHAGLKTTYYLRSMGASGVEKATLAVKKEVRGAAGETKAETATRDVRDAGIAATAALSAVERAASSLASATELTTAPFSAAVSDKPKALSPDSDLLNASSLPLSAGAPQRTFSAEEKRVCSIEAMKNGEECEACSDLRKSPGQKPGLFAVSPKIASKDLKMPQEIPDILKQISEIPENLSLARADTEKAKTQLAEDIARECFDLLLPNNWLTKHQSTLLSLWYECEDLQERTLIKRLLQRFNHIEQSAFILGCEKIAKAISAKWATSPEKTWIVAAAENSEIDGSQSFLLQLRDSFGSSWDDSRFVNRMTYIEKKVNSGDFIILVDDFTGSGTTALRKMNQLRPLLLKEKKLCSVAFVSFAGMETGERHLIASGVDCYIHTTYKKGITDLAGAESKNELQTMLKFEQRLSEKWNDKNFADYSLGFGKAEALYLHEGRRIPNNVFPVLWWPHLRAGKTRKPLFHRSRPD